MLDIYRTSTEDSALFGKEWSPLNGGCTERICMSEHKQERKIGDFFVVVKHNSFSLY